MYFLKLLEEEEGRRRGGCDLTLVPGSR